MENLATPISQPADKFKRQSISVDYRIKRVSIRFAIGAVDADGVFRETRTFDIEIIGEAFEPAAEKLFAGGGDDFIAGKIKQRLAQEFGIEEASL